jgi:CubicO group peptidase (beta-lactamase class C family)
MATGSPVPLTARLGSTRVHRRDVLIGGAVGAAVVLAPPLRARGAVPVGLDSGIRELMAAGRLPGLSTAVVREGEVVWSHAWGMANIAAGRRVTPDTLFMLASVSKTVVATAVSKRPRTACSTSTPT